MGGLKQGTEDYKYVYNNFYNCVEGYDPENYNGDSIYKDPNKPHFWDEYDSKQFKQSLGRIVNKVISDKKADGLASNAPAPRMEEPPMKSPTVAPAGKTKKAPPVMSPSQTKVPPRMESPHPSTPSVAGIPGSSYTKDLISNDEFVLHLPHHLFGWKDMHDNNRLTLLTYFPTGTKKEYLSFRIEGGGTEVVVVVDWPACMQDQKLAMFAGTQDGKPFYALGHVKVASFRDNVVGRSTDLIRNASHAKE